MINSIKFFQYNFFFNLFLKLLVKKIKIDENLAYKFINALTPEDPKFGMIIKIFLNYTNRISYK